MNIYLKSKIKLLCSNIFMCTRIINGERMIVKIKICLAAHMQVHSNIKNLHLRDYPASKIVLLMVRFGWDPACSVTAPKTLKRTVWSSAAPAAAMLPPLPKVSFGRSQNWLFPILVVFLAALAGTISALSHGIIDKILTSKYSNKNTFFSHSLNW